MTAHAVFRLKSRKAGGLLALPLMAIALLALAAASVVSYLLWPTWRRTLTPLDAPAIPVTVAGVLFDVPPAAIRAAVQRHPGAHERIDLVFAWPALVPPQPADKAAAEAAAPREPAAAAPPSIQDRLFVTIARRGDELAPAERLRAIYPHYVGTQANAGPDGLAILPFRAGTPYEGEDLVYLAARPDVFFARCSRATAAVPATCMHERALDAAEITLRFPRQWLDDWRGVAAGFDRLMARLHPQADDGRQMTDDR